MKSTGKILAVLFLLSALSCSHDGPAGQDDLDGTPGQDDGDFVSVPEGEFNQISAESGLPNFDHEISAFKIAKHQVTYELWYEVREWAEENGYEFANMGREGSDDINNGGEPTAAKHEPVTMISWRDAIVWCNAYSDMAGLTPVYTYNGNILKDSTNSTACDDAVENWTTANGYRLPSEGEWEYAARWKGNDSTNGAVEFPESSGNYWTPWNYASGAADRYDDEDATKAVAWFDLNSDTGSGKKTQTVGTKTPNALGIHDMSGNVFEWCWDLQDDYPLSSKVDYRGPNSGTLRIMRGGSYNNTNLYLQVCRRAQQHPFTKLSTIGFRVAKTE